MARKSGSGRRFNGNLHLKIRIRLTERMTKREMLRRFKRTMETGAVQDGLELVVIDWEREVGEKHYPGAAMGKEALQALEDMYRVMTAPGFTGRVEVVEP
jgi:hypothetical protein